MSRVRPAALAALACLLLAGCAGPYTLRTKVVQGTFSEMYFAPADAAVLDEPGLEGARFTIIRDPESLGRTEIAGGRSDSNGRASIAIDAFGAGWMQEQWLIRCGGPGLESAEMITALPGDDGRVLVVVLAPGFGAPVESVQDRRDLEQYR